MSRLLRRLLIHPFNSGSAGSKVAGEAGGGDTAGEAIGLLLVLTKAE